jgi:hypothetical protein
VHCAEEIEAKQVAEETRQKLLLAMRVRAGEKATKVKQWADQLIKDHAEEQEALDEAAAFVFEIDQLDLGGSIEKHQKEKEEMEDREREKVEADARAQIEAKERKRKEVLVLRTRSDFRCSPAADPYAHPLR